MHGSPNNLRITWQFFEKDFLATDAFKNPRDFHVFDEKYFDHFAIRVSEVTTARGSFRGSSPSLSPFLSLFLSVSVSLSVLCCFVLNVLMVLPANKQTAGLPLVEDPNKSRGFHLHKQEDVRPTVALLSYAAAYATWYQVGCEREECHRVELQSKSWSSSRSLVIRNTVAFFRRLRITRRG